MLEHQHLLLNLLAFHKTAYVGVTSLNGQVLESYPFDHCQFPLKAFRVQNRYIHPTGRQVGMSIVSLESKHRLRSRPAFAHIGGVSGIRAELRAGRRIPISKPEMLLFLLYALLKIHKNSVPSAN